MTRHEGSMVRRRVLGKQLRLLREQAGLTLEEAAPKLLFSVSKLSRIENAQVVIDIHWVKSMLDVYDAGGLRWTELLELAQEANQPGWWQAYGLGNNSYIAFETEASRLQEFTVSYVPGILQTADYARALMRAVPLRRTVEQLENEVAARIYRQRRLTATDNPLNVIAVIDEPALHRPVGGAEVRHEQLGHIAELAELDTVALHILPTAVGAHAAMPSGFMILKFEDLDEPDMAYVEHTLGAMSLDKASDVARARLTFERLLSDALDPGRVPGVGSRAGRGVSSSEGVAVDDDELRWFTSSFSGGNGGSCVEVAFLPDGIAVRDTKDRTLTPHRYPLAAWAAFLTGVRSGEFDLH